MQPSTLLSGLLIAALPLAFSASASPLPDPFSHQLVFSDSDQIANQQHDIESFTDHRDPDLVDQMIFEAQSQGEDLRKWGIEIDDKGRPQVTDSFHRFSLDSYSKDGEKENEVEEGYKVEVDGKTIFMDAVEATEDLVADLSSEMQRAKLLHEAALDDSLISIQPISQSTNQEELSMITTDNGSKDVQTMDPPGSGWIWKNCGTGEEAIVLDAVDVNPDPPVPGKNLTVHASGKVNHPIEEGTYADVVVKLGFIRLLSRRFDICQLARDNDAEVQCPISPGEYKITQTVELPKEIPPAKFNVHVNGKTQQDVDLMCIDLSIDFGHH